jgi:hypothetical protein
VIDLKAGRQVALAAYETHIGARAGHADRHERGANGRKTV